MNTQSSQTKIISIAILVIALVAVYFSFNKKTSIPLENTPSIATSTSGNATTSINIPNIPGKPVIRKIDMPSGALNVDQVGTWNVSASSTDGKALTYSATWGDEVITDPSTPIKPIKTNNPIFTHAYSYPGVYNPVITIYGSNGESVYASLGARVLGESKKAPIVYSLSPSSAQVGTLVTINGAGFTPSKQVPNGPGTMPSNEVLFDGEGLAGVTSNGINNLYFLIPNDAKEGKHTVQVKNPNGSSNTVKVVVIK